MKSPKEISREFVEDNLRDYLNKKPGCDLEWIKLITHISGIDPGHLEDIFDELEGFGDKKRYKKMFDICCKAKFDCEAIK